MKTWRGGAPDGGWVIIASRISSKKPALAIPKQKTNGKHPTGIIFALCVNVV
jgi:hypothetical protein